MVREAAAKSKKAFLRPKVPKSPTASAKKPNTRSSIVGSPSGSVVSAASSSTAGSRPGIPKYIQKQLAIDVEASGGVKSLQGGKGKGLPIAKLCDLDIDTYGPRGGPLRSQISNKINRWKALSKDEYKARVILKFGVTPELVEERKAFLEAKKALESSFAKETVSNNVAEDESLSSDSTGETAFTLPSQASSNKIQRKSVPSVVTTKGKTKVKRNTKTLSPIAEPKVNRSPFPTVMTSKRRFEFSLCCTWFSFSGY